MRIILVASLALISSLGYFKSANCDELHCGKSNYPSSALEDLVDTRDAEPGQFPFAVRLVSPNVDNDLNNSTSGRPHCNAVIINQDRLLTAYRCVRDENGRINLGLKAIVGSHDIGDLNTAQLIEWGELDVAENKTFALLKLFKPLVFNLPSDNRGAINSLCLPDVAPDPEDTIYFVGWFKHSNILQVMRPQIKRSKECEKLLSKVPVGWPEFILHCTKSLGDETALGGAYVTLQDDGKYEAVAIAIV